MVVGDDSGSLSASLDAELSRLSILFSLPSTSGPIEYLFVIAATIDQAVVVSAKELLRRSGARFKFVTLPEETSKKGLDGLPSLCDAIFITSDPALALHPLRALVLPPALIGIDSSDHIAIWSKRTNALRRIAIDDLATLGTIQPQPTAIALSFSPSPLTVIDEAVSSLENILPENFDLVWHDMAGRGASGDTVDVCLSFIERA